MNQLATKGDPPWTSGGIFNVHKRRWPTKARRDCSHEVLDHEPVMAGLENGSAWRLTGKLWYRLPENSRDDDNPEISDLIGRGELTGTWTASATNTLCIRRLALHGTATLDHSANQAQTCKQHGVSLWLRHRRHRAVSQSSGHTTKFSHR